MFILQEVCAIPKIKCQTMSYMFPEGCGFILVRKNCATDQQSVKMITDFGVLQNKLQTFSMYVLLPKISRSKEAFFYDVVVFEPYATGL